MKQRSLNRGWSTKITLVGASLLMVLGSFGAELQTAPAAQAANCAPGPLIDFGLPAFCGYFTNAFDTGAPPFPTGGFVLNPIAPNVNAIPFSVNSAATLINFMVSRRNLPVGQERTGAEFIIDTMLGHNAFTAGAARGDAWTNFADWSRRVTALDQAGMIDWNHVSPFPCGIKNSFYQRGGSNDDAFFIEGPASGDGCGPTATVDTIVFRNPNLPGHPIIYTLKRQCANPIGNLRGLPNANFSINLTANFRGTTVTTAYAGPRFQVVAGTVYALGENVKNNGPGPSDTGNLQVDWVSQVNQPCPPFCTPPPPQMTQLTGGHGGAYGFRVTPVVPGSTGPDWHWNLVNPLARNAVTSSSFEFTPNAAVGTTFDLDVWYAPGDVNGVSLEVKVPFVVVSERNPGFVGNNSDVHAGGGFCELPQTNPNAFIQGDSAGNSGGQYVVSASGAVGDFSSNGTGADTLKLGAGGDYAQVCRPDLYALAAGPYCANGIGLGYVGGTWLVQNLDPLQSVFCVRSGTLKLSGNVTRKLTIVAMAGANIEINGNIILGGAPNTRQNVPSLGIISAGNITIDNSATRVDAYLFADDTIDTCPQADASCATELLVNGFLMSKTLLLHRLGPVGTNNPAVGEDVVLNPEIYLNPPKFFDSSVDNIQLNGQGERPPLF